MNKSTRSIAVGVWKRYETYDFVIAPSLAGAMHEFECEGHNIQILLPNKPRQRAWRDENSPITCWEYRNSNSRKLPLNYNVHSVDVVIDTGNSRRIRMAALGKVDYSQFRPSERKRLDIIGAKYDQLIDIAFEKWINVLRWKSGIHTLCQFRYNRQKSTWGTYLVDIATRQRFYAPPRQITVQMPSVLTKKSWTQSQKTLNENLPVPIWHIYFSDASQRLCLGDTRGFIIDLAIATETLVRQVVNNLTSDTSTPAFDKLVSQIQIGRVIDDWFDLGFNNSSWRRLAKEKG